MQNERFSIKKRMKSFAYAFHGFSYLLRDEHNARIHLIAAILAIFLGSMKNSFNVFSSQFFIKLSKQKFTKSKFSEYKYFLNNSLFFINKIFIAFCKSIILILLTSTENSFNISRKFEGVICKRYLFDL